MSVADQSRDPSQLLGSGLSADVAGRLERLRSLYVPENLDAARARLERDAAAASQTFEEKVAARLHELRALYDLATYLHRARPGTKPRSEDAADSEGAG